MSSSIPYEVNVRQRALSRRKMAAALTRVVQWLSDTPTVQVFFSWARRMSEGRGVGKDPACSYS